MRRKRRNRGTWFPISPTFATAAEVDYAVTAYQFQQATNFLSDAAAFPITEDRTAPNDGTTQADFQTLNDLVRGQTWICQRVVGKIVCSVPSSPDVDEDQPASVLCCAALAVLPVDVSTADSEDVPELLNIDYQPLAAQNVHQPWLWRRTWLLGNPNYPTEPRDNGFQYLPTNNQIFGSSLDGPHLDTKGGGRRIDREQRLFLVTQIMDPLLQSELPVRNVVVNWTYDFRVFGKLVNARNRSSFK